MGKSEPKIFLILRDKLQWGSPAHAPGFGSVPVGRFGSGNAKMGVLISCVCVDACVPLMNQHLGLGGFIMLGVDSVCLACTPVWE